MRMPGVEHSQLPIYSGEGTGVSPGQDLVIRHGMIVPILISFILKYSAMETDS